MSIIPSPPASIVSINNKPKSNRVYTIHNYNNNPFMLRQDNHKQEPTIGSTIISFKREIDAIQFAYMIESHHSSTKHWPSTSLDSLTSLFVRANISNEPYLPNELYLKTWDIPTLRVYCASNILNLFVMHSMTLKENNVYSMKGEHMSFTIPLDQYANILEKMYMRDYVKEIEDEWN
jgi:hypothetical protein